MVLRTRSRNLLKSNEGVRYIQPTVSGLKAELTEINAWITEKELRQ